jgi:hypothetical protein
MYNDGGMGLHTPFSPLFVEPVSTSMGTGSFLFNRVRVKSLSENNSEGFSFLFQAGDIDLPIPLPPHFLDTKKSPPSP